MASRPQDAVLEEARRWFVRLQDEDATETDRDAFERWLSASTAHRAAWARTERLWSRLDIVVPVIRARDAEEARRAATIVDAGILRRSALSRRAWMHGAVAAGALGLVGGGYVATHPGLFADYHTAVAQRQSLTLPDGSDVELASDTALSLAFDDAKRRVVLHRGEAFFTVAPDVRRPFVVAAGGGETKALGTAFDVKWVGNAVNVAVVEHAVLVSFAGGTTVTVSAGSQIRYDEAGFGPLHPADVTAVEAWRQDRLFFQDTPLRDVVADLERYRHGRIVITDRRIGDIPVTGIFRTDKTEDALQTIADTLPVRVSEVTSLLVVIRPR
ncbi:MAG TPA: FecR family protein [Stellaceae bacterium]|nr:FecR family protein [Stellaceae bacterium]